VVRVGVRGGRVLSDRVLNMVALTTGIVVNISN